MSEQEQTTQSTEGDEVKKVAKGKKRKDTEKKEEKAKEPKVKKEKKEKVAKEPKIPKAPKEKVAKEPKTPKKKLIYKISAPKGVTVEESTFITVASLDADKKKRIWVRGSTVGLTEKVSGLKGFKSISEDEAKKAHLGRTRMIGKISSQEDLNELVKKFFA
jgi:hypothetical protein